MRRQVKVGVYIKKTLDRVLRTCFASRRSESGLDITEETALLPQWQWRFEVDRCKILYPWNVDTGPCQPARFWDKIIVYYLKAVALLCVVTRKEESLVFLYLRLKIQLQKKNKRIHSINSIFLEDVLLLHHNKLYVNKFCLEKNGQIKKEMPEKESRSESFYGSRPMISLTK